MSDPVEQGEQVDVERLEIAYTAAISQRDRYRTSLEAARERVRLLEQREKGLRELVAIVAQQQAMADDTWKAELEALTDEPSDG